MPTRPPKPPVVAPATGATVHVAGPRGVRTIAASKLFVDALTTSLADDEMVEIEPRTDLHGSAPFRRAISAELVRRALLQAGIG